MHVGGAFVQPAPLLTPELPGPMTIGFGFVNDNGPSACTIAGLLPKGANGVCSHICKTTRAITIRKRRAGNRNIYILGLDSKRNAATGKCGLVHTNVARR